MSVNMAISGSPKYCPKITCAHDLFLYHFEFSCLLSRHRIISTLACYEHCCKLGFLNFFTALCHYQPQSKYFTSSKIIINLLSTH